MCSCTRVHSAPITLHIVTNPRCPSNDTIPVLNAVRMMYLGNCVGTDCTVQYEEFYGYFYSGGRRTSIGLWLRDTHLQRKYTAQMSATAKCLASINNTHIQHRDISDNVLISKSTNLNAILTLPTTYSLHSSLSRRVTQARCLHNPPPPYGAN